LKGAFGKMEIEEELRLTEVKPVDKPNSPLTVWCKCPPEAVGSSLSEITPKRCVCTP